MNTFHSAFITTHLCRARWNLLCIVNSACKMASDSHNVTTVDLDEFLHIRKDIFTDYGALLRNGSVQVRVASYNILSKHLATAHKQLYFQCNPKYVRWKNRVITLFRELNHYNPDIICLQEMEEEDLTTFKNHLFGYDVVYKKRTREKTDGCAIFFRKQKFECDAWDDVEYYQPCHERLDRDNVGIIVKLKIKDSDDKYLVVANTHLLYNPKRSDIRLAQLTMLLAEVDRISYRENAMPNYYPTIVTGDFNAYPDSMVISLASTGQAVDYPNLLPKWIRITDDCQHEDVVNVRRLRQFAELGLNIDVPADDRAFVRTYHSDESKRNPTPKLKDETANNENSSVVVNGNEYPRSRSRYGTGFYNHRLRLSSAYPLDVDAVTTFQNSWRLVDYMFYGPFLGESSGNEIKLVSYMKLPTSAEAEYIGRMPNHLCGSDHYPLIATFSL